MPAGILQPGGVGTPVYVYDNAAAANPALGYTFAEISAAFPAALEPMVGATSLVVTGGTRAQYKLNVSLVIGGQNIDGVQRTWLDDSNVDLFLAATGSLSYRTAGYSNALLRTTFGERTAVEYGTFKSVSGYNGVNLYSHSATTVTFRGGLYLYGCCFHVASQLAFTDSGSGVFSEIAGCYFQFGLNMAFGNNLASPSLSAYNSVLHATSSGNNPITAIALKDAHDISIAAVTPLSFIRTGALFLQLRDVSFIGQPTTADVSTGGAAGDGWKFIEQGWSDTVGVPRSFNPTSPKEYWYFNTKVVDSAGVPVSGIPVQLTSDLDGILVDQACSAEGDVSFTNVATGVANMILVREIGVNGTTAHIERTFTLKVNTNGLAVARNTGYGGRVLRFQWPGRDIYRGAYSQGGGTFRRCIVPVNLDTIGTAGNWTECEES